MSARKLKNFLLELAGDPVRARRFTTDAKAFAKELHEADLTIKQKLAILSRDADAIKEALGEEAQGRIIRILGHFKRPR